MLAVKPLGRRSLFSRRDPLPDGICCQSGVGMEPQLFGDFLLVKFHCLDGDAENLGDFLASAPFRHQLEDLTLPGSEIRRELFRPSQEGWSFRAETLLDSRTDVPPTAPNIMKRCHQFARGRLFQNVSRCPSLERRAHKTE